MVFASLTFLFVFLPIAITLFFLLPAGARLGWLLFSSLVFYGWSSPEHLVWMLLSILLNYVAGLAIHYSKSVKRERLALITAIILNISALGYFKYLSSMLTALGTLWGADLDLTALIMPVGISFYTFQAISYLIDLYRREVPVQRNPLRLALYIALFPQLIAGPIVRYKEIEEQLTGRLPDLNQFLSGIARFIIGLSKKVLIANTLGTVADQLFRSAPQDLSAGTVWVAMVCYSFQIYFDFSGYSDMAIGLGRIFGFEFPENFNYPYISRSITEFWRRWHITLSTWFRDYLYIPLGGNRAGRLRTYCNLLTVFVLCGLWHGAAYTFLLWGIMHGALLTLERAVSAVGTPVLGSLYLWLSVLLTWVMFRSDSVEQAINLYCVMFGVIQSSSPQLGLAEILNREVAITLVVAALCSTRLPLRLSQKLLSRLSGLSALIVAALALTLLFALCTIRIYAGGYNPFIYFRF